jgi:hypothetical protein
MSTGKQRGGGDLAQQIASLESRMTEDQVATARKLAEKQPEAVIRMAVKLISQNKPTSGGLTKRDLTEYENKKNSAGVEAADKWRAFKLNERANKAKKSKVAK